MQTPHQEIIREIVADLLEKMGFSAVVEVSVEEENAYLCMARLEQDQNFLIGQYGVNLAAIQHIVRALLRKKLEDRVAVTVDINDYFSEKRALLEKEAEKAAEEALKDNISVALRPMLPYERKIVHAFLSKNPKIITESTGKGEERKVMVRPRPELVAQSTE